MESLFLLALGEEEYLAALAMTGLEAFFNKLLEFENVGPMFEHAKDVNYLDLKDMEISVTDPSLLSGHFLFCKSREWSCEDEVRLVLPRKDGRINVKFDPVWLTRIMLGKAMSEENKNTIRLWAKERRPELAVATT
jgi:hypothetical protein